MGRTTFIRVEPAPKGVCTFCLDQQGFALAVTATLKNPLQVLRTTSLTLCFQCALALYENLGSAQPAQVPTHRPLVLV